MDATKGLSGYGFYFRLEAYDIENKIHMLQDDENSHYKKNSSNSHFLKNDNNCEFPFPCRFLDACSSGTMNGYSQKKKLFSELKTIFSPLI